MDVLPFKISPLLAAYRSTRLLSAKCHIFQIWSGSDQSSLKYLILASPQITSIEPLARLPLRTFKCAHCSNLDNIAPIRHLKIETLDVTRTPIKNLVTLLDRAPLRTVFIDSDAAWNYASELSKIRSLTTYHIYMANEKARSMTKNEFVQWTHDLNSR